MTATDQEEYVDIKGKVMILTDKNTYVVIHF